MNYPDQPFASEPFPDEMDFARLHEQGRCDSTCDYCKPLTAEEIEREESNQSHWADRLGGNE